MAAFDLLHEGWIPCVLTDEVVPRRLGLRETLARAPAIREIAHPSPMVTVALHRLLLAILHRNFGPRDTATWQALRERGAWDITLLDAYFTRWQDRFDLFGVAHPFYQTPGLDPSRAREAGLLMFQRDGSGRHFNFSAADWPSSLTAADAACYLLGLHVSDVGGIKTGDRGRDFANAAPLVQCAVTLVRGRNLFETLLLNLHQYSAEDEEPFRFDPNLDRPAWERDVPTAPIDRPPDGYLDLLTWQSRRILLCPREGEDGEAHVRAVVVMKGYQFPPGYERLNKETMLAFQKNEKAKLEQGEDPWPPLRFQPDRALWRDSLALFQSVENQQVRPKLVSWLNALAEVGAVSRAETRALDVLGLAVDRARLLFWRHERLPLPLRYLHDEELVAVLRQALGLAETVAGHVHDSVRRLAQLLLAPDSDQREARQPHPDDVRALVKHLDVEALYWPRLEAPFKQLLVDLPDDQQTDAYGEPVYGATALPTWARAVRTAARAALQTTIQSLDTSARAMKAAAAAERQLHGRLRTAMEGYQVDQIAREPTPTGGEA